MFNYETLYQDVCCLNCSVQQIDSIKSVFRDQINSKRRFDTIKTLSQLLKVLENRDFISHDSYEPLIEIANWLEPTLLQQSRPSWSFYPQMPASPMSSPPAFGLQTNIPLDKVRYKIASSIGQKWQDFARALKVPEGIIDQLARSSVTPMERVYRIIEYHQQNSYDRRQFEMKLLEALAEARRNDLRVDVQNILYA